jgi:hypothetical protein
MPVEFAAARRRSRPIDLSGTMPRSPTVEARWRSAIEEVASIADLAAAAPAGYSRLIDWARDEFILEGGDVVLTCGVRGTVRGLCVGRSPVIVERPGFDGIGLSLDQLGIDHTHMTWDQIAELPSG